MTNYYGVDLPWGKLTLAVLGIHHWIPYYGNVKQCDICYRLKLARVA